jgi:hypothetical protein
MDVDNWDRDFARLGALMRNEETLEAYGVLHEQLLTAVVNMRLIDLRGIADGLYAARLHLLQALGQEQMAWARVRWPEECARAERDVKETREAQFRRECGRMN